MATHGKDRRARFLVHGNRSLHLVNRILESYVWSSFALVGFVLLVLSNIRILPFFDVKQKGYRPLSRAQEPAILEMPSIQAHIKINASASSPVLQSFSLENNKDGESRNQSSISYESGYKFVFVARPDEFFIEGPLHRCHELLFARLTASNIGGIHGGFLKAKIISLIMDLGGKDGKKVEKKMKSCRFFLPGVEYLPAETWHVEIITVRRLASKVKDICDVRSSVGLDNSIVSSPTNLSLGLPLPILPSMESRHPDSPLWKRRIHADYGSDAFREDIPQSIEENTKESEKISMARTGTGEQKILCPPPNTTLDFVVNENVEHFLDLKKLYVYPFRKTMKQIWDKISNRPILSDEILGASIERERFCRMANMPGYWLHVNPNGDCPGDSCEGFKEIHLLNKSINKQRQFHHIYVPFGCKSIPFKASRYYQRCLNSKNLLLAGDSRMMHMFLNLQSWLGDNSSEFLELHKPYRLGLRHALHTNAGEKLRASFKEDRTVVLNSVLHDVADFYQATTRVKDVALSWSDWVTCNISQCKSDLVSDCKCRKRGAIQAYIQTIRKLTDEIALALKGLPQKHAKLYWISFHRQPPISKAQKLYSWQSPDIIWELESYAAAELESVGVQHIDLRPMLLSSPPKAWDDQAHFGSDVNSLLSRIILHAMLSEICST